MARGVAQPLLGPARLERRHRAVGAVVYETEAAVECVEVLGRQAGARGVVVVPHLGLGLNVRIRVRARVDARVNVRAGVRGRVSRTLSRRLAVSRS